MLAGRGEMRALCQSREEDDATICKEREGDQGSPPPLDIHVCCNESNVAAKWGRLIKLLGARREQTQEHQQSNSTDKRKLPKGKTPSTLPERVWSIE